MSGPKIGLLGTVGWEDFYNLTEGRVIKDVPSALTKDILIFTGGEDVDPSIYGEGNRFCSGTNLLRDLFERNVLVHAIESGVKVLGVCRGHQLINAVLGGKLYQDILKEAGCVHGWYEHVFDPSPDKCWRDSSLAELFPVINSYHHQAVELPGKGMEVLLRSHDGIIESTANETGSIVTFQFHPEWDDIGIDYFKKVMATGQLIW